jgi:alpha-tubulin suppressor-like RCC1 family protein
MKITLFTLLVSISTFFSNHSFAQRIAAGGRHSLAICVDSTVEAWGYNGYGKIGNGNQAEQQSGTQVIGLIGVIHVAGGLFHSIFVKNDSTVWYCGRNTLGPLGDGTNADTSTPVQVSEIVDIFQAEAGGIHSVFLRNDGSVWSCGLNSGDNNNGQLGYGTSVDKLSPVQVISTWGDRSMVRAEETRAYSLFQVADRLLSAAGRNNYGQLGYGEFTTFNSGAFHFFANIA